ncbi:hypothetical protein ACOSQ2_022553 [Xanthoceras sorbifolium]
MVKIGPRPQLRAAGMNPAELSVLDPLFSLSFFDIPFDSQMGAISTTFHFFFSLPSPLLSIPTFPLRRSHSPCAQPLRPCDCAPAPPRSCPCAPATVPLRPRPYANCAQPHLAHLRNPSPSLAQPPRTGRK